MYKWLRKTHKVETSPWWIPRPLPRGRVRRDKLAPDCIDPEARVRIMPPKPVICDSSQNQPFKSYNRKLHNGRRHLAYLTRLDHFHVALSGSSPDSVVPLPLCSIPKE